MSFKLKVLAVLMMLVIMGATLFGITGCVPGLPGAENGEENGQENGEEENGEKENGEEDED